jgi:hypothetical protein
VKKLLNKFLFLACLAVLIGRADGQSSVTVNPDCVFNFSGNATGATTSFDNRTSRCAYWRLTWEVYGAGAAVSGTFQDAPSNNAGTAAGTFVTFAGTTQSGSNPSTAVNSTGTYSGFYPWVRVNFTSLTGSYRGTLLGWKEPSATSSGGGGGVASHVIVDSGNINVDNFPAALACATDATSTLAVSFTTLSGSQQLVAASGSTRIYVCSILVTSDTTVNLKLVTGTGSNCGTGTADLTGPFTSVIGFGYGNQFRTAASQALCLNTSASASGGGLLVYVQQ